MKLHSYKTMTDVAPEKLYHAVSDVNRWPEWDDGLESTKLEGPCITGASFTLKPKGGPNVKLVIEEAIAPTRLTDIAYLPLARMRTVHSYDKTKEGTEITMTVQVTGPLAFFWDRIIARPQIADAPAQIAKFIASARELP